MTMIRMVYKFVRWDVSALETLAGNKVYRLREKINNGEKLSREEKNWITEKVNRDSYFNNSVSLLGYRFDFSDVLKTFVVKQYGDYLEYKAIDKTGLRAFLYGRISKIIEV